MSYLAVDVTVFCLIIGATLSVPIYSIITAKVGRSVKLLCYHLTIDDVSNVNVRWSNRKDGMLTAGNVVLQYPTLLSVDKPTPKDWNLLINSMKGHFVDVYTCVTDRGTVLANVTLHMEIDPTIDELNSSSKNVKATEHSTVTLQCAANGVPTPNVTWYRGSMASEQVRNTGVSGKVLIMRNIARHATGIYTCEATNTEAKVTREFNVQVIFQPEISVYETVVYGQSGQAVFMACAVNGWPVDEISWIGNDGTKIHTNWKYNVKEEPTNQIIPMHFLTMTMDQSAWSVHDLGTYKCQARQGNYTSYETVEFRLK